LGWDSVDRLGDVERLLEVVPLPLPVRQGDLPADLRVVGVQLGDDPAVPIEAEDAEAGRLSQDAALRVLEPTRGHRLAPRHFGSEEEVVRRVPDAGDADGRIDGAADDPSRVEVMGFSA